MGPAPSVLLWPLTFYLIFENPERSYFGFLIFLPWRKNHENPFPLNISFMFFTSGRVTRCPVSLELRGFLGNGTCSFKNQCPANGSNRTLPRDGSFLLLPLLLVWICVNSLAYKCSCTPFIFQLTSAVTSWPSQQEVQGLPLKHRPPHLPQTVRSLLTECREPVLLPYLRLEGHQAVSESTGGSALQLLCLLLLCAHVPLLVPARTQARGARGSKSAGSFSFALPLVPRQDPHGLVGSVSYGDLP